VDFNVQQAAFVTVSGMLTFSLLLGTEALLEKLTVFQLLKKFPAFYGTRRFITAFTSARHLYRTKISVQVRDFLCEYFVTSYVFTVRRC
jgi:hypothetical protein